MDELAARITGGAIAALDAKQVARPGLLRILLMSVNDFSIVITHQPAQTVSIHNTRSTCATEQILQAHTGHLDLRPA